MELGLGAADIIAQGCRRRCLAGYSIGKIGLVIQKVILFDNEGFERKYGIIWFVVAVHSGEKVQLAVVICIVPGQS
jgi:hypothetical protein